MQHRVNMRHWYVMQQNNADMQNIFNMTTCEIIMFLVDIDDYVRGVTPYTQKRSSMRTHRKIKQKNPSF